MMNPRKPQPILIDNLEPQPITDNNDDMGTLPLEERRKVEHMRSIINFFEVLIGDEPLKFIKI